MNILAIDDVQLIRKMIKQSVETLDGTLLEASNGIEALRILRSYSDKIDVILLDWNMPEMDGFQLLNNIKQSSKFKHIPVIMTTSVNERDKIIKAIQAGASHYLIKPFTPQELIKRILECTGGTEPVSKAFSVAAQELLGKITTEPLEECLLIQELTPTMDFDAEAALCGQIPLFGQKSGLAVITAPRDSALAIVSSIKGQQPSDLSSKELVEGFSAFLNDLVQQAAKKAPVEIATPVLVAAVSETLRISFGDSKLSLVAKRFSVTSETINLQLSMYIYLF